MVVSDMAAWDIISAVCLILALVCEVIAIILSVVAAVMYRKVERDFRELTEEQHGTE